MNKQMKTVLLLFGGESSEHDVSIMSAKNVFEAIDQTKVHPVLCYIDRRGGWWSVKTVEQPTQPGPQITPVLGARSVLIGSREVVIDAMFPVLHGKGGEDGTVQGLAALMHVPIVGCGLDGSLLCMDKVLTKQLLVLKNIPTVPGRACPAAVPLAYDDLARELGPILFVKPARQGSSVGVGKATTKAEYEAAFREAARYDDTVLIEAAVENARELEVAVFGDPQNAKVSVVGEVVPDREFYDYDSKYSAASSSQTVIPAAISADMSERIKREALRAYQALHCRGLARVDFFLDANGELFLNEVNTMPGFTNISMYPKLMEASGMSQRALVMALIEQAV